MNFRALERFTERLAAGRQVYGLWVTLESPSVTEMAVALGLDWVVIDAEHGHLDWKEIVEHLRAAVRSDTIALVRLAELNAGAVKRALDLGADGVVIPWVESAEQLRQAVQFARYPLEGRRGIGAERATAWGQALVEYTEHANDRVLVVPILETVRAIEQVPQMLTVDGVKVFFFGPADLSSSAGYRGQWQGPGVAEMILHAQRQLHAAGKHCGLMSTSVADLLERREQGFQMIGVGADAGLLLRSLRESLRAVDRDRALRADLSLTSEPISPPVLARPPEAMRPDRPEVMTSVGAKAPIEIAPGVSFECLVGEQQQARNLTTGIVTFASGARLPYHSHAFAESVTVLNGPVDFEVEGRLYVLDRLDNVTIPRGVAHAVHNSSYGNVAVHIAMASDTPSRTLVETKFSRQVMPANSSGRQGAERVTRFHGAPRGSAGPNTQFIDYFNADLMPGLEMSGGYGYFEPRGRLPAHVHDFDESICIISGRATCVVEGRRYMLSDRATALQPRGRVHYFINESDAPMEMIWVYAGPRPERIVVAEACATLEGDPWK